MFAGFHNSQINQRRLETIKYFILICTWASLRMTMENHFLRIRANIAVWRLGGRLGRERWTDSSLQLHCCIIVSPDIRRWWINPYCSCFYQYYRILIVWCNLMSLNCKITPSPPSPSPPTKKNKIGFCISMISMKVHMHYEKLL